MSTSNCLYARVSIYVYTLNISTLIQEFKYNTLLLFIYNLNMEND